MTINPNFHSHGISNVPFSWEQKPGVSKLALHSPEPYTSMPGSPVRNVKIPPPPCRLPVKEVKKWGEDPFFVAYRECTGINGKFQKVQKGKKGSGGQFYGGKKSKFSFSCKSGSCEVRDDGFVKVSQLPKLPVNWK